MAWRAGRDSSERRIAGRSLIFCIRQICKRVGTRCRRNHQKATIKDFGLWVFRIYLNGEYYLLTLCQFSEVPADQRPTQQTLKQIFRQSRVSKDREQVWIHAVVHSKTGGPPLRFSVYIRVFRGRSLVYQRSRYGDQRIQ